MVTLSPARIREIAQAVVDFVNTLDAASVGDFKAKRSYSPSHKQSQLDEMKVDVFPLAQSWSAESRGGEEATFGIEVVFQKKCDRTDVSEIDGLVDIVTSVADSFLIGKTFIKEWDHAIVYKPGQFALNDGTTYRCMQAGAGTNLTDPNFWVTVNPIMVVSKDCTLQIPKENDTKNLFVSFLDLLFLQWLDTDV